MKQFSKSGGLPEIMPEHILPTPTLMVSDVVSIDVVVYDLIVVVVVTHVAVLVVDHIAAVVSIVDVVAFKIFVIVDGLGSTN